MAALVPDIYCLTSDQQDFLSLTKTIWFLNLGLALPSHGLFTSDGGFYIATLKFVDKIDSRSLTSPSTNNLKIGLKISLPTFWFFFFSAKLKTSIFMKMISMSRLILRWLSFFVKRLAFEFCFRWTNVCLLETCYIFSAPVTLLLQLVWYAKKH